jgi:hypothetical protein
MQKMLQIKFLRHIKKWKFSRHSEVWFRETASTVVDINEKLTTFLVLREKKISNNTGHNTRLYIMKSFRKVNTTKI